jgi:tRNA threonylcarbamoyladenosine biosynthesis protein TsaE
MEWRYKLEDIREFATRFWKITGTGRVIAFHGNLGSGKTTFIHALCDVKNVKGVVGSPSFSIINEYVFNGNGTEEKIFHIDLYRLKDEREALMAGVEDCLYSRQTCLVEWPEKAIGLFPGDTIHVYMEAVDDETRRITIRDN